jgi:phosphohistidine phosphatase
MGEVLKSLDVKPDLILASSAKRAKKTALILAEKLKYPEENILFKDDMYLASDSEIASFIHRVDDDVSSLFVIAHNPGLTNFINRFSEDFLENLPTAGVFAITFDTKSWKDIIPRNGKKLFFEYPKKHL